MPDNTNDSTNTNSNIDASDDYSDANSNIEASDDSADTYSNIETQSNQQESQINESSTLSEEERETLQQLVDTRDEEINEKNSIKTKELEYHDSIGSVWRYIIVKNTSNKDLKVRVSTSLFDKKGKEIEFADEEIKVISPKSTSIACELFDSRKREIKKYKSSFRVEESTLYEGINNKIKVKTIKNKRNVIIYCTNNSNVDAEFVKAYALFYNKGKLIYADDTYVIDDDNEIKAGKTEKAQIDVYYKYDKVEVYLDGRADL